MSTVPAGTIAALAELSVVYRPSVKTNPVSAGFILQLAVENFVGHVCFLGYSRDG